MKKIMSVCLVLVLALGACCAAAEAGKPASRVYYGDETGISFPYPEGWERMDTPLSKDYYVGFAQPGNTDAEVMYFRSDMWGMFEEHFGGTDLTREQMNGDYMTEEFVAFMMNTVSVENLRTAEYGEVVYWLFDAVNEVGDDPTGPEYVTAAMTMDHGYFHAFRLSAGTEAGRDALMPEFEALLAGVRFTAPDQEAPVTGSRLDCIGTLTEGNLFYEPGEIAVKILVRNIGDEGFERPVELFYPDLTQVEEFGSPVLKAGQSLTWEGKWTLTQEQLEQEMIAFYARYQVKDAATGEWITKAKKVYMRFTYSK